MASFWPKSQDFAQILGFGAWARVAGGGRPALLVKSRLLAAFSEKCWRIFLREARRGAVLGARTPRGARRQNVVHGDSLRSSHADLTILQSRIEDSISILRKEFLFS